MWRIYYYCNSVIQQWLALLSDFVIYTYVMIFSVLLALACVREGFEISKWNPVKIAIPSAFVHKLQTSYNCIMDSIHLAQYYHKLIIVFSVICPTVRVTADSLNKNIRICMLYISLVFQNYVEISLSDIRPGL